MFWKKKREWFGKHLDENIKALNEGDLGRLPWIFCVFTESDSKAKLLAAKTLSNVLKNFKSNDIIEIDTQMRATKSIEWNIDWHEQKIEKFFTPAMNREARVAVLVFASFNSNGFIREKAVQMMSAYDGCLPYIILRQNDWVPQVRQAARRAFDKRMKNLFQGELFSALPFAEKLKWGRRDLHEEYTQKFLDKLVSEEYKEDLARGLKSESLRIRRICTSALFEATQPNVQQALERLVIEPEPFLRTVLFEKLCEAGQDMDKPAHIMLKDKYARNRIIALQYLYDKQAEDIYNICLTLLVDKNAFVRMFVRNIVLKYNPNFDFLKMYIDNIENVGAPAILGIGEIGKLNDAEIIEGYVNDSCTSIVQAVLVSLMWLNSEKYKELLIVMLTDSRNGVVKTAQRLILKYNFPNYSRTFEIFRDTPYEYTKIKCTAILFKAPKWERLIYMLEALSVDEERIRLLALQSIRQWILTFNRSYSQISDYQKDRIKKLIENQKKRLSNNDIKELMFLLN